MTAVVVIVIALLVGVGLVLSQLVRLRDWLGTSRPELPGQTDEEEQG